MGYQRNLSLKFTQAPTVRRAGKGLKNHLPYGIRACILIACLLGLQWLSPLPEGACFEIEGALPQKMLEPEIRMMSRAMVDAVCSWESWNIEGWSRLQALYHRLQPPEKSYRIVAVETIRTSGRMRWPVEGAITSGFGYRRHPVTHRNSFHAGIDIRSKSGVPIKTPMGGVVSFARRAGANGNLIKISCGNDVTLAFAHLSKMHCFRGQLVRRGQVIGLVGASGRSTGPHLHFAVQNHGRWVNPLSYLE